MQGGLSAHLIFSFLFAGMLAVVHILLDLRHDRTGRPRLLECFQDRLAVALGENLSSEAEDRCFIGRTEAREGYTRASVGGTNMHRCQRRRDS